MSAEGGPNMVYDGLVLYLDAANLNSYTSGSTSWYNLVGSNNTGILTNGPTFNTGSGGNIVFDGINDYVSLGTFTGLGSISRTYSTWFRTSGLPSSAKRFVTFPANDTSTDTPAYILSIGPTGIVESGLGGNPYNGYISNIPYTLGSWMNVTTTIASNVNLTYVNGVYFDTKTNTGAVATNPIGYLGRYNGNYGQYLTGSVACFSLYKRALSAAEILQNYNATKSRFNL